MTRPRLSHISHSGCQAPFGLADFFGITRSRRIFTWHWRDRLPSGRNQCGARSSRRCAEARSTSNRRKKPMTCGEEDRGFNQKIAQAAFQRRRYGRGRLGRGTLFVSKGAPIVSYADPLAYSGLFPRPQRDPVKQSALICRLYRQMTACTGTVEDCTPSRHSRRIEADKILFRGHQPDLRPARRPADPAAPTISDAV